MFQVILPNIYVYPNDVVCREGAVADVTVTIALIHTFTIIICYLRDQLFNVPVVRHIDPSMWFLCSLGHAVNS